MQFGFDKRATQEDSEEGLVKRGVVEESTPVGSEQDGFIDASKLPRPPERPQP